MKITFPEEMVIYQTYRGQQLCGDSKEVLKLFPNESVDLIMTSPPFALLRKKSYGNKEQAAYVEWLLDFGRESLRVLKDTGSFVLDLGGAYQQGRPIRSLYNYRILMAFCDLLGYGLAEEFFWYNPAKLPSPIEWVNKRKIRAKDAVNTVWWFSKGDFPKADVRNVLVPYSERMKKLLSDPDKFYRPKDRPSGHQISNGFANDRGGAIPSNLLQIPNTDSNSHYLRTCKAIGEKRHPARYPADLPKFFIEFLTDPDDLVVDIFSGSNTTGYVAEELRRNWVSIEVRRDYAALSAVRFMEEWQQADISHAIKQMKKASCLDLEKEIPPNTQLKLLKETEST